MWLQKIDPTSGHLLGKGHITGEEGSEGLTCHVENFDFYPKWDGSHKGFRAEKGHNRIQVFMGCGDDRLGECERTGTQSGLVQRVGNRGGRSKQ